MIFPFHGVLGAAFWFPIFPQFRFKYCSVRVLKPYKGSGSTSEMLPIRVRHGERPLPTFRPADMVPPGPTRSGVARMCPVRPDGEGRDAFITGEGRVVSSS